MDVCNKIDTTIVAANAVAIRRRIIELAFKAGKMVHIQVAVYL